MEITIQTDLEGVNWDEMGELYGLAFDSPPDAARQKRIFEGAYLTRIAHEGDIHGRIIGAGYAISDSFVRGEGDATIHGVAVLPALQGQGIGKLLMQSILDGLGDKAILLTSNFGYESFYAKFGFRRHKTAFGRGFPEEYLE